MPHQRQLIREAIKAALVGQTGAGSRVSETRTLSYRATELPAISIFTSDEEVDAASMETAPRELKRRASIVLECVTALPANGAVDDALDDLARQVEIAMHRDTTFGGACADSMLTSSELGVVDSGNRPMGAVQLTFSVWYYTGVPEAADQTLTALQTVNVKTSLGGAVHPGNQSEDKLEDLDE